jgi:ribosomal protein L7/L12
LLAYRGGSESRNQDRSHPRVPGAARGGLEDARDAIEAEDRGAPLPPPSELASAPSASIEALAQQGRLIEAIKLYREQMGVSLVDAKQAVERLRKSVFIKLSYIR